LEGSVRSAGGEIRINAQLIDAGTGGHVWAERYDSSMTDTFALQDRITRNVVAALRTRFVPGHAERLMKRRSACVPEKEEGYWLR
jgi:adenylate cyclase